MGFYDPTEITEKLKEMGCELHDFNPRLLEVTVAAPYGTSRNAIRKLFPANINVKIVDMGECPESTEKYPFVLPESITEKLRDMKCKLNDIDYVKHEVKIAVPADM